MSEIRIPFVTGLGDVYRKDLSGEELWLLSYDAASAVNSDDRVEFSISSANQQLGDSGFDDLKGLGCTVSSSNKRAIKDAFRRIDEGCFAWSSGTVGARIAPFSTDKQAGDIHLLVASHPVVAVRRCLLTLADEENIPASVHVRVKFNFTHGSCHFDTVMTTGFEDAAFFDTSDVRGMVRGLNTVNPEDLPATPPLGDEPVESFADVVDVHGDVGARALSVVEEYPELSPKAGFNHESLNSDDPANNASLQVNVSPQAKYWALAGMVAAKCKAGDSVLVIGDHPGTLGRALLTMGLNVYGLDPRNEDITEGIGDLVYRQVPGSAVVVRDGVELRDAAGKPFLLEKRFNFAVIDTSTDEETAVSSTARNLAIARSIKVESFFQARSLPMTREPFCILDLPGHSNQGSEVFVRLGAPSSCGDMAWAAIRLDDGMTRFNVILPSRIGLRGFMDAYFDSDGNKGWVIAGIHWYSFVVTRAFIRASNDMGNRVCASLANCKSPLEALAILETQFPATASHADQFEISEPQHLVGVSPGLFRRHVRVAALVATRYEYLVAMCRYTLVDPGPDVFRFFSTPASGVLLRRLSRVRACDTSGKWPGPMIGNFKRVLPFELMAVLAHKPLFGAVLAYVRACSECLGKPMHAWELQYLLWTLTMHGTDSERFHYLSWRITNAMRPGRSGRSPPLMSTGNIRELKIFDDNLRTLGVYEQYVLLDERYHPNVARIFNKANNGAGNAGMGRYRGAIGADSLPKRPYHAKTTSGARGSVGMYVPGISSF